MERSDRQVSRDASCSVARDVSRAPSRASQASRLARTRVRTDTTESMIQAVSELPKCVKGGLLGNPLRVGMDKDSMREKVKRSLIKPTYNVCDLYHREGVFQAVARHGVFEKATLVVIFFNAIWIWIDTDHNKASVFTEAQPPFQLVEYFFCVYFACEWMVRFLAFRWKRSCFQDAWFCFDSALVFMMVLESWVMSAVILLGSGASGGGKSPMGDASILRMARLLRLSRMARMVRLFRAVPELLILVKGIVAATRSVVFTLILLAILLYVFAIALRQLTDGTPLGDRSFPTVPTSMYTLLIDGTFMDSLGSLIRELGQESVVCVIIFWIFVLLSSCTVMNMLIGVLCEVVSAVAHTEKETMLVNFVKERMKPMFDALDTSGDGLISKEEFQRILDNHEAVQLLEEVGVDVLFLVDQSDTLFQDSWDCDSGESRAPTAKTLTFESLMEVILELRGTNFATVKHIVEIERKVLMAIAHTQRTLMDIEDCVKGGERLPGAGASRGVERIQMESGQSQTFQRALSGTRRPSHPASAEEAFKKPPPLVDFEASVPRSEASGTAVKPAAMHQGLHVGFLQPASSGSSRSSAGTDDLRRLFASQPSCVAPLPCDSLATANVQVRPPGPGPPPMTSLGVCVPQPRGDSALPESFAADVDLKCLLKRLESVASDALCRVHQDFMEGISDTVQQVAAQHAEGSNDPVPHIGNGHDFAAVTWPGAGIGPQPPRQEPPRLGAPFGSHAAVLPPKSGSVPPLPPAVARGQWSDSPIAMTPPPKVGQASAGCLC